MPKSEVRELLATFLFVSGVAEFTDPARTVDLVTKTAAELGPFGAQTALEKLARAAAGDPEATAARMAACREAVESERVQIDLPGQRTVATR